MDPNEFVKETAVDWALSHGLVIRPPDGTLYSVVHAPFALFPTAYPRECYDHAFHLMPLFNKMVDNVARDGLFLSEIMDSLSKVDDFVAKIYDVYKKVEAEGVLQKINLGLHRSDYLLHTPLDGPGSKPVLQQVELNTIASSFSSLSNVVNQLHRYLHDSRLLPESLTKRGKLVENTSIQGIPKGIASAFKLYSQKTGVAEEKLAVIMVVQPGERNAFDQRWIEYTLLNKFKVRLFRKTLAEIGKEANLVGDDRRLFINGFEIAVTYFRAGYAPTDYPTDLEWDARLLVERSYSVKCPTAAYHLVGTKKLQQVLAKSGIVEKYLDKKEAAEVRTSFTGLYPLDDTPEGHAAVEKALKDPAKYVMKPQREGGGNNIYGKDIPGFLSKLTVNEREAFILMDLINHVPVENIMVRNGVLIKAAVVSEFGTYGIWLSEGDEVHLNETGGYLMRTKSHESNEGGVAAGFAVLDSPLLV
ncbi:glutathione synthase [Cladochytrium replicatum]|nr:glutathione synthase [Cladochytrium replicatum]